VVVDEAGMVSTELLLRIFRFLKPARLVLVGDPKQLPCVDGLPALHTLLQAPQVPRVELRTRWRRAGRAPGALDVCLETLGTPAFDLARQDDSFRVVECDSQEECYAKAAAEYRARECQMLAYTNAAVQRLNELTDDRARKQVHGVSRVGDRVVCTENAYDKAKGRDPKKLLVANGTCGTVREGCVRYDNGFVDAGFKRTKFAPCRAMTVNKSQGNEYEVHGVVVVAPWNGPPPLELMYTALSRFKVSVAVFVRKTQTRQVFFNSFKAESDVALLEALGDDV
jgi:ATP-dependent exoDNAse (exonuclease V) alpha subunit